MITVIGCDGSPLSSPARQRLAAAALVVGGRRHLSAVGPPARTPTMDVRDIPGAVEALRALPAGADAVVLASGDPGFFGILRRLRERFGEDELEVLPAVSSVAAAFARARLPWDDALVVSAHGRDPARAVAACRAHPKVAVLTGPGSGPAELGTALAGARRRLFVAERLGTADERCAWLTPTQAATWGPWAEPNVVLSVDDERTPSGSGWSAGPRRPDGWALPEDAFDHRDGMVTKAEVRALVLARLGPRLGDLVWDIGAGSGSVAVECARLGAAVVAVEQGDCAGLTANAARHDVDVQVVQGRAPEVLAGLPDPDAAFVGGGGPEVVAAVAARQPARLVVALAAVERVAPVLAAMAAYDTEAVLLSAQRLVPLAGAHRLAPVNPVFVVSGVLA